MASASEWIEGARPRTLPAAVAPVAAGTGLAAFEHSAMWPKALLALVVALALQIGVNYANDYSDGIRGTDADRVGPLRLVGSGVASASAVKAAAFGSFAVACLAGLVLAATTTWWLVAVGAAAVLAAWFYTGGAHPYGYLGLGELSVFVFFGLVAVVGTTYTQVEAVHAADVWVGAGVGALACALLVANNLRDLHSDEPAGKRTLAVVLGDGRSRLLFAALHAAAYLCAVAAAVLTTWWALLAGAAVPWSWRAVVAVRGGAAGRALISPLRDTGRAELGYAVGLAAGLTLAAALG